MQYVVRGAARFAARASACAAVLLLAGASGCAAHGERASDAEAVVLEARIAPRLVVAPELAMPGVAAVSLWEAATLDAYAPDLVVSDDCTGADLCVRRVATRDFECSPGDDGFWWACFTGRGVVVWTELPDEWQVSVLAHELGHSLGLEHADAGIMWPGRDRSRPCIEDADVEALEASTGIVGAPACVR